VTKGTHRAEDPAVRRQRRPGLSVLVVAIVLATIGGTAWATREYYRPKDRPDRPSSASVQSCRIQWAAQMTPLSTAETSVSQWQLHVDAMNQLVAGEITLGQAVAFWNQTKVDAVEKIRAFDVAWSSYRKRDYACLDAEDPALDRCQKAVQERETVLQLAFDAVDTWHHHVMDMRSLMAGKITPEDALARWKHFWRQGIAELNRYQDAVEASSTQRC